MDGWTVGRLGRRPSRPAYLSIWGRVSWVRPKSSRKNPGKSTRRLSAARQHPASRQQVGRREIPLRGSVPAWAMGANSFDSSIALTMAAGDSVGQTSELASCSRAASYSAHLPQCSFRRSPCLRPRTAAPVGAPPAPVRNQSSVPRIDRPSICPYLPGNGRQLDGIGHSLEALLRHLRPQHPQHLLEGYRPCAVGHGLVTLWRYGAAAAPPDPSRSSRLNALRLLFSSVPDIFSVSSAAGEQLKPLTAKKVKRKTYP